MHLNRIAARLTASFLLVSSLIVPAFAVSGTVNSGDSSLRVRESANTDSSVLKSLDHGTSVEVLGTTESGWYQISHDGTVGFVSGDYLMISDGNTASIPVVAEPVYLKVTASSLNVRSGAGVSFSKVGKLGAGAVVKGVKTADGWYQIDSGYISADYVSVITAAEAAKATTASSKGSEIAAYALTFVGSRYVYGGSSPSGFDCSGFTSYVYRQFGYTLNRSSSDQLDNGTAVSMSNLQPGDLVIFKKGNTSKRATHVGLYIGNGQFVHASTAKVGVIVSSLSEAYYTSGFVGGRRIV